MPRYFFLLFLKSGFVCLGVIIREREKNKNIYLDHSGDLLTFSIMDLVKYFEHFTVFKLFVKFEMLL